TNASGIYQFTGLKPGTYGVSVVPPSGYVATVTGKGTTATDSNPNPTSGIVIVAGSSDQTIDFGFYQTVSIGNYVWLDCNGNGVQDMGDVGIANVTVKLFNSSNVQVATTTTNANGIYGFNTMAPGSYTVQFVTPSGYVFTPANVGSNMAIDSNANTTTGK